MWKECSALSTVPQEAHPQAQNAHLFESYIQSAAEVIFEPENLHNGTDGSDGLDLFGLLQKFPTIGNETARLGEWGDGFIEVDTELSPSYLSVHEWEQFNLNYWRRWIGYHWSISVYSSLLYVILIFYGQALMRNRPAFSLRGPLTLWNISLAAFSILGFLRTAPEIFHLIGESGGVHRSICIRDSHNAATAFWGWLMTLSKLVELGDTAFIVLRKQPLIFLHWYHHITVLIYTWFTYEAYDPPLRWFMTMNMFVHAVMYSYYALKSLKIFVPRSFAMMITTLQLSQMVLGVSINIYSLWAKLVLNTECNCGYDNIALALSMYASYFVLFANFFYKAYVKKRKMA